MGAFVMTPVAMLDDDRLQPIDVLVYGIILAVDGDRDGVSVISLRRIGERIRRCEKTAERSIERLANTGWLQIIDNGIGRCRSYRPKTPDTGVQGVGVTPDSHVRGLLTQPPTSVSKTPDTSVGQPITLPRNVRTLAKRDETHLTIVALLERCGFNGEADAEAMKASEQCNGDRVRLIRWLNHCLTAKGVDNPLGLAIARTREGIDPQIPRSKGPLYPLLPSDGIPERLPA